MTIIPAHGPVDLARYPCYHVTAMIRSFKTTGTEDIFNGDNTQAARKTYPQSLWKIAARKLDLLDSVRWLDELSVPPPVIGWRRYTAIQSFSGYQPISGSTCSCVGTCTTPSNQNRTSWSASKPVNRHSNRRHWPLRTPPLVKSSAAPSQTASTPPETVARRWR